MRERFREDIRLDILSILRVMQYRYSNKRNYDRLRDSYTAKWELALLAKVIADSKDEILRVGKNNR